MEKLICTKTFETKEAFLQDTIDYFGSNPSAKRCLGNGSATKCAYNPFYLGVNKPESEGCAIGRFMTLEQAEQADDFGSINILFDDNSAKELLPDWMIKFGKYFLALVQELHDGNDNWGETGLTQQGINNVKHIIKQNNLDESKINLVISK